MSKNTYVCVACRIITCFLSRLIVNYSPTIKLSSSSADISNEDDRFSSRVIIVSFFSQNNTLLQTNEELSALPLKTHTIHPTRRMSSKFHAHYSPPQRTTWGANLQAAALNRAATGLELPLSVKGKGTFLHPVTGGKSVGVLLFCRSSVLS